MAQISMEAALEAAQQRVGELAWENVLLKAQTIEADAENQRLREQAAQPPGAPEGSGAAHSE